MTTARDREAHYAGKPALSLFGSPMPTGTAWRSTPSGPGSL